MLSFPNVSSRFLSFSFTHLIPSHTDTLYMLCSTLSCFILCVSLVNTPVSIAQHLTVCTVAPHKQVVLSQIFIQIQISHLTANVKHIAGENFNTVLSP